MSLMDNIIAFPRNSEDSNDFPATAEDAKKAIEAIRHVYLNEVTEVLVSTLIQQMMTGGFNILDEEHQKDFAFLIEAVRSCLCKTVSIYHPFQDVSEKIMEEHGEPGVLSIADAINVKFQDDESPDSDDEPNTSETGI